MFGESVRLAHYENFTYGVFDHLRLIPDDEVLRYHRGPFRKERIFWKSQIFRPLQNLNLVMLRGDIMNPVYK